MIPIHYSEVEILDDRIVNAADGRVLVRIDEVWAIGYKKRSIWHGILTKHDWMAMGILYIGKKSAMKVQDLIPIIMPYKKVKELPKRWAKKTEFYEFGGNIKIKRII